MSESFISVLLYQYLLISVLLPLFVDILVGLERYLMVLICSSIMTNRTAHFFVSLFAIYIYIYIYIFFFFLLKEMSIQILCLFLNRMTVLLLSCKSSL